MKAPRTGGAMAHINIFSVGRRAGVLALMLSAALVAGISPAAPAHGAVARTSAVARPASFTAGGILNAVAATSARNAWAVGQTVMLPGGSKTLIAHWNGAVWRPGPLPRPRPRAPPRRSTTPTTPNARTPQPQR